MQHCHNRKIRKLKGRNFEDILSFKTCFSIRVWDQNLELHVKNGGNKSVVVASYFDLEGDEGVMDEEAWKKARRMVFYDNNGERYTVEIGPWMF